MSLNSLNRGGNQATTACNSDTLLSPQQLLLERAGRQVHLGRKRHPRWSDVAAPTRKLPVHTQTDQRGREA